MNNNYIENSDEAFYAFIDDNKEAISNKLTLPEIAARFTEDAVMDSNYNNVPSSLAFFTFILTLNVSAVVPSLLHTTSELIVV